MTQLMVRSSIADDNEHLDDGVTFDLEVRGRVTAARLARWAATGTALIAGLPGLAHLLLGGG
jgi:hypothetical protein